MREMGMWMTFGLVCLVFSLGLQAAAQPTVWDFEKDSRQLETSCRDR